MVRLLLAPDPGSRLLGLTRELCALKLSERSLLASLAAARRSADGARLQCGAMAAALHLSASFRERSAPSIASLEASLSAASLATARSAAACPS